MDIVEMLRKVANQEFGTYDVRDDSVRIGCQTLRDAAFEIERLRSLPAVIGQRYEYTWPSATQWPELFSNRSG